MTTSLSENVLNDFAKAERVKAITYLRKNFTLSEEDYEDILQEAFDVLLHNIKSGKLESLTSSLSSYFIGICRNKAFEWIRKNKKWKGISVKDEVSLDIFNTGIKADKIDEILKLENDEDLIVKRKEALVRKIVSELPSPCSELLWGYFWENLKMRSLAQIFHYKNENSVKVTKHRCQKKFQIRFNELKEELYIV